MKTSMSLRSQLVLGTAAWTAGLVVIVNWVSLTIIRGRGGMHLHIAAMLLLAVGAMAAAATEMRDRGDFSSLGVPAQIRGWLGG